MKPIPFPEANTVIGGEIPANRNYGVILTRWKGNWRERLKFLWFGQLWLAAIGDTLPPLLITSDRQFEMTNAPKIPLCYEPGCEEPATWEFWYTDDDTARKLCDDHIGQQVNEVRRPYGHRPLYKTE